MSYHAHTYDTRYEEWSREPVSFGNLILARMKANDLQKQHVEFVAITDDSAPVERIVEIYHGGIRYTPDEGGDA